MQRMCSTAHTHTSLLPGWSCCRLSTEYLQLRVALWWCLCSGCSIPMGWLLFTHKDGCAPSCLVFIFSHAAVLWSCSQKGLNLCLATSFPEALWAPGCGRDRDVCWGHWKAELGKAFFFSRQCLFLSRQCLFCPWTVLLCISTPILFSQGEKASVG